MSVLHIHWQPKQGESKTAQIAADSGKSLPSTAIPGLGDGFQLARPTAEGWQITLPAGVDGKAGRDGKWADFAALRGKGMLGDNPAQAVLLLGANLSDIQVELPSGRLVLRVEGAKPAAAPPPAAQPAQAQPTPVAARPPAPGAPSAAPPPAQRAAGGGGGNLPVADSDEPGATGFFRTVLVLALLLHIGLMAFLASVDVPDDLYAEPTEIPERFAKLIVPKVEEKKPEESGAGEKAEEAKPETAPKDDPGKDEGGGGVEEKSDAPAPRSREEVAEQVRQTGLLAILGSKREGGGALSDVLSEGGLAAGLDQALSDVGGVALAERGTDVRSARGAGGGQAAEIGDLGAGRGRGVGLGDRAERKVVADVQTASFTSQGSLSADAIRDVVQRQIRGVTFCYERQLANKPDLQGKVVIRFTIGEDGSVTAMEVEDTTLNDTEVEGCILQRVRRWRFPAPDSGPVTVSYPFIFSAAS